MNPENIPVEFKSLGEAVKMIRQMRGLGFEACYTNAGVSKCAYHNLESGKTLPQIITLSKVGVTLGLSIGNIFILAEKIQRYGTDPLIKQLTSI